MADDHAAEPERTDDGHHIVVGRRRWRATDPEIPDRLGSELRAELMRARRLIGQGHEGARPRVGDAKVALGERGEPWWEDRTEEGLRRRIRAAGNALIRAREGRTVCPSELARVVDGGRWRSRMELVRAVAGELSATGQWAVLQSGTPVDLPVRGPIRIGPGESFPLLTSGSVEE